MLKEIYVILLCLVYINVCSVKEKTDFTKGKMWLFPMHWFNIYSEAWLKHVYIRCSTSGITLSLFLGMWLIYLYHFIIVFIILYLHRYNVPVCTVLDTQLAKRSMVSIVWSVFLSLEKPPFFFLQKQCQHLPWPVSLQTLHPFACVRPHDKECPCYGNYTFIPWCGYTHIHD